MRHASMRTRFPSKLQPPLKFEVIFCVRGVVSPLLANIYLHYVFDLWIEAWRRKVAQGDVIVVRYADDLVVGFESRAEAERFLEEFRERLAKFGLELHAEKTRLIEFGRFARSASAELVHQHRSGVRTQGGRCGGLV